MFILSLLVMMGLYYNLQQNTNDLNQCLCYQTQCSKVVIGDIDCTDVYTDTCNFLVDTALNPKCAANCTCSINGVCQQASNVYCFFLYWKYVILIIAVLMILFGLHMSLSLRKRFFSLYRQYNLKYFYDVNSYKKLCRPLDEDIKND